MFNRIIRKNKTKNERVCILQQYKKGKNTHKIELKFIITQEKNQQNSGKLKLNKKKSFINSFL